ncbi:MAG TPA: AI-2E family transporter [Nitrospiraceae bacterium]|nr:AI-2E family transporter [Nitrospiraceae bacterium]
MLRENDPPPHLFVAHKDSGLELPTSPKSAADRHLWQIVGIRDVLFFALLLFLLWFGYYLRSVFTPVLIALMLAYLVDPIIDYFEERRVPRPVTVSVVLVVLVMILAGLGAWLGPLLIEQSQALAKKAPQYLQSLSGRYGIEVGSLSGQITSFVDRFKDDPMSVIQPLLTGTGTAFGFIGSIIGTTTGLVLFTVLIPIYFFFFAWHFDRITGYFYRFLPASRKEQWLDIFHRMDLAISGFFRGRLFIALITGVMYAVGWFFTDVPYWFLLGLATGLLSIVPYISVVGWPLAVLLKYLDVVTTSGASSVEWLSVFLWPSVAYLAVQFIESWVLTPWIQSQSTDMSAVTVLIVVFIGGAVGGIYGLLLAIPIAACLKILFQELVVPRVERWAERH